MDFNPPQSWLSAETAYPDPEEDGPSLPCLGPSHAPDPSSEHDPPAVRRWGASFATPFPLASASVLTVGFRVFCAVAGSRPQKASRTR